MRIYPIVYIHLLDKVNVKCYNHIESLKGVEVMRVFPIKDRKIIGKMKEGMRTDGNMKMLLMFTLGLNTGFRISDLLKLTYEDLRGERIMIIEQKTGKKKDIPVPPAATKVFCEMDDPEKTGHIFTSNSNRNKGGVWSQQHIARELKYYAKAAGFTRNVGTHTMRKTFGYWRYILNDKNIGLVQDLLNHSSSSETIKYIGIDEEARDNAYTNGHQQL